MTRHTWQFATLKSASHRELSKTWFSHSFFIISKVTLQRLPPSFFFFFAPALNIPLILKYHLPWSYCILFLWLCISRHRSQTKEPECGCVHRSIFVYVSGLVPIKLVLYCRGLRCVRLIDVWSVVVSLSRMCNEPCFASVTFQLIDYKQRSFNKQGCCFLTMLHSVIDEITRIARGKTPCFCSRRVAC